MGFVVLMGCTVAVRTRCVSSLQNSPRGQGYSVTGHVPQQAVEHILSDFRALLIRRSSLQRELPTEPTVIRSDTVVQMSSQTTALEDVRREVACSCQLWAAHSNAVICTAVISEYQQS